MSKGKKVIHPITGETRTVAEWAQKLGITTSAMSYRLSEKSQFSLIEALFSPTDFDVTTNAKPQKMFTNPKTGEKMTAPLWAKTLGISENEFWIRVNYYGENNSRLFYKRNVKRKQVLKNQTGNSKALTTAQWIEEMGLFRH